MQGNFWDVDCIAYNARLLHLDGAMNGYISKCWRLHEAFMQALFNWGFF